MRLTLDDPTYQHILNDAEIRDMTITGWVTGAFTSYLHHNDPVKKEVFVKEGDRNYCQISPLHVEFIHGTGQVDSNDTGTRNEDINRLKLEIEHLKALLYERGDPSRCITEDEADLIRLNGEIGKASIELDGMEAAYERKRMECEKLSQGSADRETLCEAQAGLEREGYEISRFQKEIDMLMEKRDILMDKIEKKGNSRINP